MNKRELLKALRKVQLGDQVTINGRTYQVDELVEYKHGHDEWFNIVFHDEAGKEIALEIEGSKLSLWRQVDYYFDIGLLDQKTMIYEKEEYRETEFGIAETISRTRERTKEADTPYWVFEALSGHRLAVEIWERKHYAYYSEGELPASAVQV